MGQGNESPERLTSMPPTFSHDVNLNILLQLLCISITTRARNDMRLLIIRLHSWPKQAKTTYSGWGNGSMCAHSTPKYYKEPKLKIEIIQLTELCSVTQSRQQAWACWPAAWISPTWLSGTPETYSCHNHATSVEACSVTEVSSREMTFKKVVQK